ncbi:unnamed protein product [Mucor hiemalis]
MENILSMIHSNIDRNNINLIFDPEPDGFCGYRAVAYLIYGDQDEYKKVKKEMLKTLEENLEWYKTYTGSIIPEIERNIRAGMDGESSKTAIWYKTPDCAQIAADTYNIPVCVYTTVSSYNTDQCLTFLPFRWPTRHKVKIQPLILQHVVNHWLGIKCRHLQMKYPLIQQRYFDVDAHYERLFKTTWNLFGQFPKFNSSTEKAPSSIIELSDEDEE